jgi:hypothetical protein
MEESGMPTKKHKAEEIVAKLRQVTFSHHRGGLWALLLV